MQQLDKCNNLHVHRVNHVVTEQLQCKKYPQEYSWTYFERL